MASGEWLQSSGELDTYWPLAQDEAEFYPLDRLLAAARVQCEAFAPTVPEGEVPENYRVAQAMQTRALFRSQRAGGGDQFGADGMTVTVFPMDWTVKALLRPKKGAPKVR